MVSCKKKCNCSQLYDSSIIYVSGNLVFHNGKCWKAVAQRKGIELEPWLQNGNDIWKECQD